MSDPPPAVGFPPPSHVYRDLGLDVDLWSEGRAAVTLDPGPWTHVEGRPAFGPIVTAADVLAGALVATVVAPDWMATSSLTLHRFDATETGAGRTGIAPIDLVATIVRAGRTTVVVDLEVSVPAGRFVAGTATFVRLPRRDDNLPVTRLRAPNGGRVELTGGGQASAPGFDAVLEPVSVEGGWSLTDTGYLRNSVGAVNGGVLAAFAELVARRSTPPGSTTEDAEVHFLRAARSGPFVATAEVVPRGRGHFVRVDVVDRGAAPSTTVLRSSLRLGGAVS